MAISSADIEIYPPAAKAAGCSAAATLVSYDDLGQLYPGYLWGWFALYEFAATAAGTWRFDHWEQSWSWTAGADSGSSSGNSTANPWRQNGSARTLTTTEENDGIVGDGSSTGVRTITSLRAVFDRAATGLILHSPTNLRILHGAGGTILRDD